MNPVPPHSDEIREQALAMVRDGRHYEDIKTELGIPKSTLSRWATSAGIEPAGSEQTAAATEAAKMAWAQRRALLVDALGEAAAELLDKAREAGGRDAQAFMTAVAIGVDKAQLLSGGVTSRHEQLDAQRRRDRILAMQDELAERRARKDGTTGG